MKISKQHTLLILVPIVFVVLVSAGTWLLRDDGGISESNDNVVVIGATEQPGDEFGEVFESNKYGFAFSHPEGFRVTSVTYNDNSTTFYLIRDVGPGYVPVAITGETIAITVLDLLATEALLNVDLSNLEHEHRSQAVAMVSPALLINRQCGFHTDQAAYSECMHREQEKIRRNSLGALEETTLDGVPAFRRTYSSSPRENFQYFYLSYEHLSRDVLLEVRISRSNDIFRNEKKDISLQVLETVRFGVQRPSFQESF